MDKQAETDQKDPIQPGESWSIGEALPATLGPQSPPEPEAPPVQPTFTFSSLATGLKASFQNIYEGLASGLALHNIRKALREDANLRDVFYHGGKNALIYLGVAYAHEFAHQMLQAYYADENSEGELPSYVSSIIMATLIPLYIRAVVDSYLNATTEQIILMQGSSNKNAREMRLIKQPKCNHSMEYSVNALLGWPLTNTVFYGAMTATRRNLDFYWLGPILEAMYYGKTLTYPYLCNKEKAEAQKKHALSVIGYGASPWVITHFLNFTLGKITGVQTFYTEHAISILAYYVALVHAFSADMDFKENQIQFEAFGLSNLIAEGAIEGTKKSLQEGSGPALVDAKTIRQWMAFHDRWFKHVTGIEITSLDRFTNNRSAFFMVQTLYPTFDVVAEHLGKLHRNPKLKMGMWAKYVTDTLGIPLKGADTLTAIDYLIREGWLARSYLQSQIKIMRDSLERADGSYKHASHRNFKGTSAPLRLSSGSDDKGKAPAEKHVDPSSPQALENATVGSTVVHMRKRHRHRGDAPSTSERTYKPTVTPNTEGAIRVIADYNGPGKH